jgi:hypothetical protein
VRFPNLAKATLKAVGDPIAFSRNQIPVITLDGVYRNKQELAKSNNKKLRVIDCDVVIVPYSALVQSGDDVNTGVSLHKVAGKPVRDSSGGMIVRLESANIVKSSKVNILDR